MAVRTAKAVWHGSLKEGKGELDVESGAFKVPYDFVSRFEAGSSTNPEELIGAAHAGCFTMFLSSVLTKAGHVPERLATTAKVHLDEGTIHTIELEVEGKVPGIDQAAFNEHAENAKQNCPVSKLLASAKIVMEARLQ
jgi:osmotically inducible protein OsmC